MNHASDLAHDLVTLDFKERDLQSALRELAGRAKELFSISCRFKADGEIPALEVNTITQLYKIAQEAVTNAIKHGRAKRVDIDLGRKPTRFGHQNSGLPFRIFPAVPPGWGCAS
jgi:signal transduction histidine kinase